MKKIIASLTAVTFLGSSTLAVSACGVSNGTQIEIKINNAPTEAKNNQDPTVDYVYNNKYNYNLGSVNYLIAVAANLASDKIYYDQQKTFTGEIWNDFYRSNEWRSGNFSNFNYDINADLPSVEQGFSYNVNNNADLIYQINNNDGSVDNNKLRIYWFITSPTAWDPNNTGAYAPSKDTINIPNLDEFNEKNEPIIRTGWIHLYLIIGGFRLDFTTEINFVFNKVIDKNGIPLVVTSLDTFAKPFGDFKFEDVEEVANTKIVNLTPSRWTPPAPTKE